MLPAASSAVNSSFMPRITLSLLSTALVSTLKLNSSAPSEPPRPLTSCHVRLPAVDAFTAPSSAAFHTFQLPLTKPLLSSLNSPVTLIVPFFFPVSLLSFAFITGSQLILFTSGPFTSYEMLLVTTVSLAPWLALTFIT